MQRSGDFHSNLPGRPDRVPTQQLRQSLDSPAYPRTSTLNHLLNKNGLMQLGSLGSGNHFIEIGVDETQTIWIIIHSGSRNLGHSVATHYMKLAAGGKHVKVISDSQPPVEMGKTTLQI